MFELPNPDYEPKIFLTEKEKQYAPTMAKKTCNYARGAWEVLHKNQCRIPTLLPL